MGSMRSARTGLTCSRQWSVERQNLIVKFTLTLSGVAPIESA